MSEEEIDLPGTRKALEKVAAKLKKIHHKYSTKLEKDAPEATHLRTVKAALTEVEALQEEYNDKVEAMEGAETDESLIQQDEEAQEEFSETLLATKFTIELLLSMRAIFKAKALERQSEIINQAVTADPEAITTNLLSTINKLEAALTAELTYFQHPP